MNPSTPGLSVHHQLPEFTQTHVHRVGDAISHLLLCRPLLLLPPIPPSSRVFSNEDTLISVNFIHSFYSLLNTYYSIQYTFIEWLPF